MGTSSLLATLIDAFQSPKSGVRARITGDQFEPMLDERCQFCGITSELAVDQYGQTSCSDCMERGSGDAWFDVGGG
ncbi:MAG TPA: hypothetical protein VHM70_30405 [Polyangiaceae bacterium]|jgi:hypothetical protein|nr:hypothetical protein [Polyangiaceae bacterium]